MRGLTIQDVAELTKLSPRIIAHIESGEFGALPRGLQGRAHLRSYARVVGLDLDDIEAQLAELAPAPDPLEALRVRVRQRFAAQHPTAAALQAQAAALRRAAEGMVRSRLRGHRQPANPWKLIGPSVIDAAILAGVGASMLFLSARLTGADVDDVWRTGRWPLVASWSLTTVLYFTVSRTLTGQSPAAAVATWLGRQVEHRPEQSAARRHAR